MGNRIEFLSKINYIGYFSLNGSGTVSCDFGITDASSNNIPSYNMGENKKTFLLIVSPRFMNYHHHHYYHITVPPDHSVQHGSLCFLPLSGGRGQTSAKLPAGRGWLEAGEAHDVS